MAASKALKDITDNLEEQLTCSLCQEVFTEPRSLPCLHSFCTRCIAQWFQKEGNPFNNEHCPMCKTTVVVPDADPCKLPSSLYHDSLLQLLRAIKNNAPNQQQIPVCVKCGKSQAMVAFCAQCNGMICAICFNAHKLLTELQDGHQTTMIEEFNVNSFIKCQMLCKFHEKKRLEYYCQTCAVSICQTCATSDHQNHKMQSLEDAGQDSSRLIKEATSRVEERKQNYKQELKQSKENIERIQREIDVAEKDVDDAVQMICDMAKEHGRVMKNELKQTLQEQTTANDEEQAAIKAKLEESDVFVQQCQAILERDVPYEEIESKEFILERSEIISQADSVLCRQSVERNMTICYSVTKQVMQSLLDIGRIVRNMTDTAQSTFQLLETPRGFINEGRITTRNTEGELCHARLESLDVQIKDANRKDIDKVVCEHQHGKYRVSFLPQKSGQHEIQVKIGGEAIIKNSVQNADILDVKELFKPIKTFGEEGRGQGQFALPSSIALSDNEEIAIADVGNSRIQVFSLDGKYRRHFSKLGGQLSYLRYPTGVVFYNDRIIVSEGVYGKGRIEEFDLNGSYVRTFYIPGQWFTPQGMFVNNYGSIAVCCWGHEVLDIKPSIKLLSKQDFIHTPNDKQPGFITYSNGKYFVSYPTKNCVDVFDVKGVFLYQFGEEGEQDGQFNGVRGLAAYGPDMILVCDWDNHRVQVFTQEGQFIRSFGSRGSGVGQMLRPVDVAVASDGKVFVLEEWGRRVSVWY